MKTSLILVSCLIKASIVCSQAPVVSWQKPMGGSSDDLGQTVEMTSDGGLIIGSTSNSTDGDLKNHGTSFDFWITKLDVNKDIQWSKTFGGSDNDVLSSIHHTTDGGYIAAGSSESYDGDLTEHAGTGDYADLWIIKLKTTGKLEWQRSMGNENLDYAKSVRQTIDGGYVVAGCTENDYWIVKFDAAGNVSWDKMYGGSSQDVATSIQQTPNGEYIVAGYSYSDNKDVTGHHGNTQSSDYWIIKLDASGNLLWERSLGGSANDVPNSIALTSDGAYIVAGYTFSTQADVENNHGGADYWLLKISDSGELLWQRTYGGSADDKANDVKVMTDGGFTVSGASRSSDGDVSIHLGAEDFWVVTTDASGNIIWESTYGGSYSDIANAQCLLADGTRYVIGSSISNDHDAVGNHGGQDVLLLQLGSIPVNTISLPVVSDYKPCWGENVTIDFTVSGTYNAGNIFTAEITKKGFFIEKFPIGYLSGTSSGTITATIPFDLGKGDYFLQIVSSDPPIIGDALINDIHLKCKGIPEEGRKTSNITATSATISWKPSEGCPISYQVKWRIASGNNSDNNYADATDTTYNIAGLLPNTSYLWWITTRCVDSPEVLSKSSLTREFTTSPLRLSEGLWSNEVELFPNPVQDKLFFSSATCMNGTIQVMNLIGEILLLEPINKSEGSINVSSISAGTYLLFIKSAEHSFVRKFVKQ